MKILVTGFPRSGTTIVGRVLAGLERAHYIHEVFNHRYPVPGSGFRSPHNLFRIEQNSPLTAKLREFAEGQRGLAPIRLQDLKSPRRLCRRLAHSVGSHPWSDRESTLILKDPLAFYSADVLVKQLEFVPIVMIRDPVEVAGSFLIRGWSPPVNEILSQQSISGYIDDEVRGLIEELALLGGMARQVASICVLWVLGHKILLAHREFFIGGAVVWHARFVRDPVAVMAQTALELGLGLGDRCYELLDSWCRPGKILGQSNVPPVRDVRRDITSVGESSRKVIGKMECKIIHRFCGPTINALGDLKCGR